MKYDIDNNNVRFEPITVTFRSYFEAHEVELERDASLSKKSLGILCQKEARGEKQRTHQRP